MGETANFTMQRLGAVTAAGSPKNNNNSNNSGTKIAIAGACWCYCRCCFYCRTTVGSRRAEIHPATRHKKPPLTSTETDRKQTERLASTANQEPLAAKKDTDVGGGGEGWNNQRRDHEKKTNAKSTRRRRARAFSVRRGTSRRDDRHLEEQSMTLVARLTDTHTHRQEGREEYRYGKKRRARADA